MKKNTKRRINSRPPLSKCLRASVEEEPLSADDHPENLTLLLEKILESGRATLTHFGVHPAIAIIYTAEKKLFVISQSRDEEDDIVARDMAKTLSDQYKAIAAIFIAQYLIRPAHSMSEKDSCPKETLIATAKNRNEHLMAIQVFHRDNDGQIHFEPAQIGHGSRAEDTWLGDLEF